MRKLQQIARLGQGSINFLAWSPDARWLAIATSLGVYLHDANSLEKALIINDSAPTIGNRLAFSPDGRSLIQASGKTVKVWELSAAPVLRHTLAIPSDKVGITIPQLASSPDGRSLLTVSVDTFQDDFAILLWDLESGQLSRSLYRGTTDILNPPFDPWLTLSPDLQTAASVSCARFAEVSCAQPAITLWSLFTLDIQHALTGDVRVSNVMVFSPDGHTLAVSDGLGGMTLWDVSTGQLISSLRGHGDYASALAFSPDGKILASAQYDGVVILLDVSGNKEVHILTGHNEIVDAVAFSPDGTLLATASNTQVLIWAIPPG